MTAQNKNNNSKVLITGGSGLVGKALSDLLAERGYIVSHLSRKAKAQAKYPSFEWNIEKGYIDKEALQVDHIIHLAGAGVADQRWTPSRKQLIRTSRVDSANLLYKYVTDLKIPLNSFISASAIGYYGEDTGTEWCDESTEMGQGFLADVVEEWESAADQFSSICSVTKVRIGVVLDGEGGALSKIVQPIRLGLGAPLGTGRQYMSWIHTYDLARIFVFVLEKQLQGVFNAVAPGPVTNRAITKASAAAIGKPLWLPNVPSFVLNLALGEMAGIVLNGNRVSSQRIQDAGFQFEYGSVQQAVENLLS